VPAPAGVCRYQQSHEFDFHVYPARRAPALEYLVTMTTRVPEGTPQESVDDVRGREAAHSRELAAAGHLLRLWRPPLAPGEWRTLGLFAAAGAAELEEVLASMPLRVWRTDDVMPLSQHPNDPMTGWPDRETASEFLTTFTVKVPDGTSRETVGDTFAREAVRARELAGQGHLIRLWGLPPGRGSSLGLWAARDTDQMRAITADLPLAAWLSTDITPLTPHPSDPANAGKTAGKES
jgi:muconolactone delta-isomerase